MIRARAVFSLDESSRPEAEALAQKFGLPHVAAGHLEAAKSKQVECFIREHATPADAAAFYVFLVSENPLCLVQLTADSMLRLSADFADPTLNYRRLQGGGKQQMLAKAVGLRSANSLRVLDATAGLGRDAFILASLGARVTMLERVAEVRALLESALLRARSPSGLAATDFDGALGRLSFIAEDAIQYMKALQSEELPDVIYLDPMFPPRRKSALVKKEMRILHDLVGADKDGGELFEAARRTGAQRIVVKRPRIAPTLSEEKPNQVLMGKSNRYDIYLPTA
jgi:16S rRNA (guanine1516-N2)-methyltransferase